MRQLRALREKKNMTQIQLAKAARCSASTIYQYETGRRKNLSSDCLKRIADVLGSTPEIISEEEIEELLEIKICLNQCCQLNKNKYCQSIRVCNGAYCQNQDKISEKIKVKRHSGRRQLKLNG